MQDIFEYHSTIIQNLTHQKFLDVVKACEKTINWNAIASELKIDRRTLIAYKSGAGKKKLIVTSIFIEILKQLENKNDKLNIVMKNIDKILCE